MGAARVQHASGRKCFGNVPVFTDDQLPQMQVSVRFKAAI